MASSAPIVKSIIPTTSNTAPIKNAIKILVEIGAIVKLKKSTIAMMGNTAFNVSFNFSLNLERLSFNNIKRLSFIEIIDNAL